MATYTDAQIREAAIEHYLAEHPGSSRDEAEIIVDRMLPTMPREEAIQLYIENRSADEVDVDPREQTGEDKMWSWEKQENIDQGEPEDQLREAGQADEIQTFANRFGFDLPDPNDPKSQLRAALEAAGADLDAPEVANFINLMPDSLLQNEALLGVAVQNMAQQYPSAIVTQYSQALIASGFGNDPFPDPRAGTRGGLAGGVELTEQYRKGRLFETNEETGWVRYSNGVLVDPESGSVVYEPNSTAPGSPQWLAGAASWSNERISSWRQRLHQYGYLSKEESKLQGFDVQFQQALAAYQSQRYLHNGQPVTGDPMLSPGAPGEEKPPLVDFKDMAAQIRNDVREQYERIYGVRPSDGEVERWAQYITNTGMELQRKYRGKEYGNYTSLAATEAEERFIERLEGSPSATFLRDNTEENTTLHDAISRAISVVGSLA